MPQCQPSNFAIGLPSRTRFGVATQVLRKSIPRAEQQQQRAARHKVRLPNGTKVIHLLFAVNLFRAFQLRLR